MQKKLLSLALAILFYNAPTMAQGNLSGDFQANYNFYQPDAAIGATGELYDKYLNGGEAWLTNRYSYKGFTGVL